MEKPMKLSAVVCVHNEERQLADCLEGLRFADELVVLLDNCADGSKAIAEQFDAKIVEGVWATEGDRRNRAIREASGPWLLEVDADERVPDVLAREIRQIIETSAHDWHEIPVDNYIGARLVRWGWGASFGKAAYPGLFRKTAKVWGRQRVHPSLAWTGTKGPMLSGRLVHYVDQDISDMIRRLDSYSTARALDIRETGEWASFAGNLRRLFFRFFKCYVSRKGYREGGYGFLIAVCAGLYPMLSHLKATLEKPGKPNP